MKSPVAALARHAGRSIGSRLVLVFVGLLLAVQVASFTAIRASLAEHARDILPDRLLTGQRVLRSLLEQKSQKLAEGARLLVADYGFREAVLSMDAETLTSVLENHGKRIGATEAALLGTDFSLRAASGSNLHELAPIAARLGVLAAANGVAADTAFIGGRPHQVVLVPMKAPVVVGWLMMGFPLDARLTADMNGLSALGLTVLTRPSFGDAWTVALSGLPASGAATLAKQPWAAAASTPMRTVDLAGEAFGVKAEWLTPAADETLPGRPAVVALLSVSVDEAQRIPAGLQASLLLITLLGFVFFVVGSLLTARRVTHPLRALSAAAERFGAGDHATPFRGQRREDEVGQLAQAFERMRIAVGEKQQQIMTLAYTDSLTGLPNRARFRAAAIDAVERAAATGRTVAVVMLDLDRFKHVNDVLGYRFGDLLLCQVAERLSNEMVRGGDLVARLGGDEFAVLLDGGDEALARTVAGRIGRAFDVPLTLEEHTVDMGAGIGMACYPTHAAQADELLNRAEVAMYAAKRRSDGPFLYAAAVDAGSAQTLSLLTELRQALQRDELQLYLQPKLALADGSLVGAEALVRWRHPQRGLVPPLEFIPFAEQTGFIRQLTMWVFEEAARVWRGLHADGMATTLSVNLSTRDLLDQDLPQKFVAVLLAHQVPAEAFCLEITESAIMDDPQRALGTLNGLAALGFKLSIDDFGTGYSSLAYLKRLPVDELKIDKSFVLNMETDQDDAKIVRSTIDLAHNLGLRVVAEGVENAQAWDLLRELDCDQAQGYHMGRPMPAAALAAWAAGWAARQRPPPTVHSALTLH